MNQQELRNIVNFHPQRQCNRAVPQHSLIMRALWSSLIIFAIVTTLFLEGCSTDDDRDICCEEVVLLYRYVRFDQDEYKEFVHSMRHFLFDEHGIFIREIPSSMGQPQKVKLSKLAEGRYTMLTVGNATPDNTNLSELIANRSSLRTFQLEMATIMQNGMYANGDELFWNQRSFYAEPLKKHTYICDLSNTHCHLFVRVKWHVLPELDGTYTMRIHNVAQVNSLNPHETSTMVIRKDATTQGNESTMQRVVHTFPKQTGLFCEHAIDVPLYNLELMGEFITLRYTNDHIPIFRLYFGDTPVTKYIDLAKAFKSWGWQPDKHPEQIYRIEMEIFDDGKVVVTQWSDASVLDWVNGGTIVSNQ